MLELKNLRFAYGDKTIFEKLDLSVSPNVVSGFLGRNGIGKTTLFKILSGELDALEGSIQWNGMDLKSTDVGILKTDPFFYPYMRGSEYLELVLGSLNEKASRYANLLGLPLDELIDNYSTGMRKKIAFIAIICQGRPVIILDEPFNGVDLEGNEIMKAILHREQEGRVIICSSHILEALTDCAENILFIEEGYVLYHYEKAQFDGLRGHIRQMIAKKLEDIPS